VGEDSPVQSESLEHFVDCLLLYRGVEVAVAPALLIGLMADKVVDESLINTATRKR
jgi:hypothetical protein